MHLNAKELMRDDRLDIGRFNSAEPTMNACAEPRFELTGLKHEGTNEGRSIGCRRIQFCRTKQSFDGTEIKLTNPVQSCGL